MFLLDFFCCSNNDILENKVNNDFFGLNFNFKENLQQEINNETNENDDFFKSFNEKWNN